MNGSSRASLVPFKWAGPKTQGWGQSLLSTSEAAQGRRLPGRVEGRRWCHLFSEEWGRRSLLSLALLALLPGLVWGPGLKGQGTWLVPRGSVRPGQCDRRRLSLHKHPFPAVGEGLFPRAHSLESPSRSPRQDGAQCTLIRRTEGSGGDRDLI